MEGAISEDIENSEEATVLIQRGQDNRHVAATCMNRESSRSHSIFTLDLQIKMPADEARGVLEITQTSKINLVDLAGSERQTATQAVGERLNEAKSINKSLSTLGMVISALGKPDRGGYKTQHIPYRDSKLTRVLERALGGNSRTSIICTGLSPPPLLCPLSRPQPLPTSLSPTTPPLHVLRCLDG